MANDMTVRAKLETGMRFDVETGSGHHILLDAAEHNGGQNAGVESHGPAGPFDPQILNRKGSLFLTRPSGAHYMATREELLWRSGEVFRWFKDDELKVRIDTTFPLSAAAEAHRYTEGRQSRGKVLLIP